MNKEEIEKLKDLISYSKNKEMSYCYNRNLIDGYKGRFIMNKRNFCNNNCSRLGCLELQMYEILNRYLV